MAKKSFCLGLLAIALVFGMAIIGCEDGEQTNGGNPDWIWSVAPGQDGNSTITVTPNNNDVTVTGELKEAIHADHPFAQWTATPRTDMLGNLRTATGVTFKVTGDGHIYDLSLPQTDLIEAENWDYFGTEFETTKDIEKTVKLLFSDFKQGGWGAEADFDLSKITDLNFSIHVDTNPDSLGPYSISIRDLTLITQSEVLDDD